MAQGYSRIWMILLFCSILLNGAAAGHFYSQWEASKEGITLERMSPKARQQHEERLRPAKLPKRNAVLDALPPEKHAYFLQLRKEAEESLKEKYKELKMLRAGMYDVLAAESFSEEAFTKQMEAVILLKGEVHRLQTEPLAIFAKDLTVEERKAFTTAIKKKKPGRRVVRRSVSTKSENKDAVETNHK